MKPAESFQSPGILYRVGLDLDGDSQLSAEEVTSEQILCGGNAGYNGLVQFVNDADACDGLGGLSFNVGLDADRNLNLAMTKSRKVRSFATDFRHQLTD